MGKKLKLKSARVSHLLQIDKEKNLQMGLEIVTGEKGIEYEFSASEINRPGLALSGFFNPFAYERLQVFGNGEIAYIEQLAEKNELSSVKKFFSYDIPACIITNGRTLPPSVLKIAEKSGVPVLRTTLSSEQFVDLMHAVLSDLFAPYRIFHGNFVSIHGIGVLLIGQSGIGKSETVLGLIERGHKFICDDMVKIKKMRSPRGFTLFGEPYVDHGPFIEIRGIGIINISQYYGEGKVLPDSRLELVVKLSEWRADYEYDRLGMDEKFITVMGIEVPMKEIPVSGGRNVPLLVEIAAYREILRRLGYNAAEDLDKKILDYMKKRREGF